MSQKICEFSFSNRPPSRAAYQQSDLLRGFVASSEFASHAAEFEYQHISASLLFVF